MPDSKAPSGAHQWDFELHRHGDLLGLLGVGPGWPKSICGLGVSHDDDAQVECHLMFDLSKPARLARVEAQALVGGRSNKQYWPLAASGGQQLDHFRMELASAPKVELQKPLAQIMSRTQHTTPRRKSNPRFVRRDLSRWQSRADVHCDAAAQHDDSMDEKRCARPRLGSQQVCPR